MSLYFGTIDRLADGLFNRLIPSLDNQVNRGTPAGQGHRPECRRSAVRMSVTFGLLFGCLQTP
jgi:hypothetical protein